MIKTLRIKEPGILGVFKKDFLTKIGFLNTPFTELFCSDKSTQRGGGGQN